MLSKYALYLFSSCETNLLIYYIPEFSFPFYSSQVKNKASFVIIFLRKFIDFNYVNGNYTRTFVFLMAKRTYITESLAIFTPLYPS